MLLHMSVIHGHHNIYKCVWSSTLSEIVSVDREHGNNHDCHALFLVKKKGSIIGIALSLTFFMTCLRRRHGSHTFIIRNNLMWVWSSM